MGKKSSKKPLYWNTLHDNGMLYRHVGKGIVEGVYRQDTLDKWSELSLRMCDRGEVYFKRTCPLQEALLFPFHNPPL